MKSKHRRLAVAIVFASAALLGPSVAHAQKGSVLSMRAAPASAPAPVRRAPSSGVRMNVNRSESRTTRTSASTTRNSADLFGAGDGLGAGFSLSLQDLLNITPNSGFNWEFVNAINQDLPIKAFIDPVTQIEVAEAERLLRGTSGAFSGAYILGGGGYYAAPESEEGEQVAQPQESQPAQGPQPPVIIIQQPPTQQPGPQGGVEEETPQEQIPDQGQFTLVLRSGKEIQALAFTRAQDKIVYITPEGGRATIAAADLDADATVRVNQERGTPLQLPL
jgi:hypothetical protein